MEPYSSKENKRCNYLFGETNAVYHDMAVKMGLSDSAMNILYTICDSGESCLLKEICRRSGISKHSAIPFPVIMALGNEQPFAPLFFPQLIE